MQKTKLREEQRELQVALTKDEKVAAGLELAQAVDDLDKHEAVEKEQRAELKAAREAIEARVLDLRTLVLRGARVGPVDCVVWALHDIARVRVLRADNGECIEERAMTPEEHQLPTDFDELRAAHREARVKLLGAEVQPLAAAEPALAAEGGGPA